MPYGLHDMIQEGKLEEVAVSLERLAEFLGKRFLHGDLKPDHFKFRKDLRSLLSIPSHRILLKLLRADCMRKAAKLAKSVTLVYRTARKIRLFKNSKIIGWKQNPLKTPHQTVRANAELAAREQGRMRDQPGSLSLA